NRYPLWTYLLVAAVLLLAALYALPNLFPPQPAVQVSRTDGAPVAASLEGRVRSALQAKDIAAGRIYLHEGELLVRVPGNAAQLRAADVLKRTLGDNYVVALSLATTTPDWLRAIGAKPMALGLDLRGGVHFLLEVDMQTVFDKTYERYSRDLPRYLRDQSIRYSRAFQDGNSVKLRFPNAEAKAKALDALRSKFSVLQFKPVQGKDLVVAATLTQTEIKRIEDFSLEQNLTTLRNRVNELGVAEARVARQGDSRIVVELPGVQDTAEAKRLLGKTATLQYRLVAQGKDAQAAAASGVAPPGTDLFYTDEGRPVLLKEEVIASGDQLVDASAGFSQQGGGPVVNVRLNGAAADRMYKVTSHHVGDPMAVLFIENVVETHYVDGKEVHERKTIKKIVSIATIQGVFGARFQTSGLTTQEAHDLALLLRAGALAAPVHIIGERTVGPSLGQENIEQGALAVVLGFLAVVSFMAMYYKSFGLISDAALFLNLILILAIMSIIQATLTMPGIAGMLLTVGMSVDANVLINERIREELNAGNSPQSAIAAGYDRAFSSIADGHVTTLIAAVLLFSFGTGPIKGFAVTLSIGIITSMFTAIVGTRCLVNLIYGRRRRLATVSI
ncbi:MAG: protein translocase subunit SecD, partial [Salinisphaera sp.]|nr:protein translocase subunit SecD [Salinisphaera sp.]